MTSKALAPVHPGEILREEFLAPLDMAAPTRLRPRYVCRATRVERLIREETAVTPDTALRLARYFGSTPEFWLGIQARFDIETGAADPRPRHRRHQAAQDRVRICVQETLGLQPRLASH